MNCPKCGRPVISGKTVCPYCGQAIPILSKCPSCGWKLSGIERTCPNCRVDLAPFLTDSKSIEALSEKPKAPHETVLVLIGIAAAVIGIFLGGIFAIIDIIVGFWLWKGGSTRKGKMFVAIGLILFIFTFFITIFAS